MTRKITELEKQWFLSSAESQINDLKNLVEKDPNLASKKDFVMGTALHWAAKNGRSDMVEFLLELGVDIDVKTGYTPLHLATMYNHNDVVLLLVDNYGASIDARDHSGKRPKDYLRKNAMPSVKDKLQKRDSSRNQSKENPMINISNMFQQMCVVTPPQPFCLLPMSNEIKSERVKISVRRSPLSTTFRKARPKLRKPTSVCDDQNHEAKKKIGPPIPLNNNFLDFSRVPRNERALSEPDVGRLIKELKLEET